LTAKIIHTLLKGRGRKNDSAILEFHFATNAKKLPSVQTARFTLAAFPNNNNNNTHNTQHTQYMHAHTIMSNTNATNTNKRTGSGSGPPRKESILELAKLMDATVRVKCLGGRELQGTLKGYDELVNLVLDDCQEFLRNPNDPEVVTDQTRTLGLVVVRGTQVSLVSPQEGVEEIANPFLVGEEEEEEEEEE
jgi:U6 snRNA-associated Sm-like protein LSm7